MGSAPKYKGKPGGPAVPAGPTEAEKQEALEKEKAMQRRAHGRRSTMVTGGLGLTSEPWLKKKILLGQ